LTRKTGANPDLPCTATTGARPDEVGKKRPSPCGRPPTVRHILLYINILMPFDKLAQALLG
jgi:hypothetical protein